MSHLCPDCGLEHDGGEAAAAATEPVAEASVRIAEIEADRDVTIARLGSKTEREVSENDLQGRVIELEGQLAGMAVTLAALSPTQPEPESEPVPIVVDEPEPEPVMPEPVAEAPPMVEEPAKQARRKSAWF